MSLTKISEKNGTVSNAIFKSHNDLGHCLEMVKNQTPSLNLEMVTPNDVLYKTQCTIKYDSVQCTSVPNFYIKYKSTTDHVCIL